MLEFRNIRACLDGLSVRSQNTIVNMWADRAELPRPSDIAQIPEREWRWQPGAGMKTVLDIRRWLAERGLQMPTEESEAAAALEAHERAELARLKAKYESS